MGLIEVHTMANIFPSMDWFKGTFTGHPYISWENPWFPVDFTLSQSIDNAIKGTEKRTI